MAAKLPQISGTQRIAPTSVAGVQVATDSPVSRIEIQGYSDLAARMDQLSGVAFKYAFQKAETSGFTYGALAAPTAELVEKAREVGRPITAADLPGDPNSISFSQQAARKGAIAVVEDRIESAGRRALTEAILAAASDPATTPEEFGLNLDNIVKEYSESMEAISPGSAAKVSASLALIANGQAVSFSRTYATEQAKLRKNEAISEVTPRIEIMKGIIEGYDPNSDVPLDDLLATQLEILENKLDNGGVSQTQINVAIAKANKQISDYKVAVISEWASTGENIDSPTASLHRLDKGTLPPHIQSLWDSMDPLERTDAREAILFAGEAIQRRMELDIRRQEVENETSEIRILKIFNNALVLALQLGDPSEHYETAELQIVEMEIFDPDRAQKMRERLEANFGRPIISNRREVEGLGAKYSNRVLTTTDVVNAELSSEDFLIWIDKIRGQTDDLMGDAEALFKGRIQPPASNLSILTNPQILARNRFNQAVDLLYQARRKAEKANEYFDPPEAAREILDTIMAKDLEEDKVKLRKTIEIGFSTIRARGLDINDNDIKKMREIYWQWDDVTARRGERPLLLKALEAWNQLYPLKPVGLTKPE